MITTSQCFETLLGKFPDFEFYWEDRLLLMDDIGPHNVMTEFSHYIMYDKLSSMSLEDRKDLFSFMEECMVHGEEDLQGAVATCFLENLLNVGSAGEIDFALFVDLLGPEVSCLLQGLG